MLTLRLVTYRYYESIPATHWSLVVFTPKRKSAQQGEEESREHSEGQGQAARFRILETAATINCKCMATNRDRFGAISGGSRRMKSGNLKPKACDVEEAQCFAPRIPSSLLRIEARVTSTAAEGMVKKLNRRSDFYAQPESPPRATIPIPTPTLRLTYLPFSVRDDQHQTTHSSSRGQVQLCNVMAALSSQRNPHYCLSTTSVQLLTI